MMGLVYVRGFPKLLHHHRIRFGARFPQSQLSHAVGDSAVQLSRSTRCVWQCLLAKEMRRA